MFPTEDVYIFVITTILIYNMLEFFDGDKSHYLRENIGSFILKC
jgi:hypothetical protein